MFLRHAEPQDIFDVAQNMRVRDFEEISSLRYVQDRDELAYNIANQISEFETVYVVGDTEPVAIVSYIPVRPGVWNLGMFATDKFKSVGLYLTKRIIRDIIPALDRAKAHRIEAFSIEGYDEVHDWLEFLGLEEECTLSSYGKNGEDFKVFSWVRSEKDSLVWQNRRVH
jgi:hypothetical protein|tara:strand:- start:740 stop:1246 length:507 start_codon:yes stop_codon:yes gene_type:complete